ncbi:MAG: HD-GYP domain-containing protein [Firmicutes bacterium]|nr:HD-GYP domain-containing protein [Bacillota bacterium]
MLRYLFISPFFVYIYSIVIYGVLSTMLRSTISADTYALMVSYGDVVALLISFFFAWLYSSHGDQNERRMRFFVYTGYYMTGMVFTLTYESIFNALFFSVLIPILVSLLIYRYIALPLAEIFQSRQYFYRFMLILPMVSEVLMVLRLIITVISTQNPLLIQDDAPFYAYMTLFGYLVLMTLFLSTNMTCRVIRQVELTNESNAELIAATESKKRLTFDMLKALVATIEAKDEYTIGHSARVALYSKMIAQQLQLPEEEVERIHRAALLHDIGKIAVPDAIINKPSALTKEEYAQIMRHPIKGGIILKGIEELPYLYQGANYHHERWDGKGYPEGLIGEEIPYIAQIISVADAYDAMSSNRPYRRLLEQEQVRDELEKGIGTQFSPGPVQAMLSIMDDDAEYHLNGLSAGRQ